MPPKGTHTVASNRKARHDYDVVDTFDAGIVLRGAEVKSLRDGKAQIRESYARIEADEVFLHGVHIPPYAHASSQGGHDPDRSRKLLLHRREIVEISHRLQTEHLNLVPLAIYFKDGLAKVELALGRPRKNYDKRHAIAARDSARDTERELRRHTRPLP